MEAQNRGHAAFLKHTKGYGQKSALARRLKSRPNQVTQWASGKITPSGPNRTKIQRVLKINASWWDEPVRRKGAA